MLKDTGMILDLKSASTQHCIGAEGEMREFKNLRTFLFLGESISILLLRILVAEVPVMKYVLFFKQM